MTFALVACSGDDSIHCALNADCLQGGIGGTCEASPSSSSRWCAFPDPGCAVSGQRWGVRSGDGLAGTCVAAEAPPDAGLMDAAPDAATCTPNATSCNG